MATTQKTRTKRAPKKAAEPKHRVAHFVVEGAFLTEISRNLFVSDAPAKAWRLLKESLMCDDEGAIDVAARDILDGKMKLTGDSTVGLKLVKDDAKAHIKLAQQIYAGRVRINGAWYRPASRVVLDAASGHAASRIVSRYAQMSEVAVRGDDGDDATALLRLWWKSRLEWGGLNGQIAREVPQDGIRQPLFVLFEPVSERPFWWPELHSEVEAYADYNKHWRGGVDSMEVSAEDITGHEYEDEEEAEAREESETTALRTAAKQIQEELDAEAEDARANALLVQLRIGILAQAGDDLIELAIPADDDEQRERAEAWGTEVGAARVVHIPRAPFMHWAQSFNLRGTPPPWTPVSPSGLKCHGDNVYHTDWMIGAGLDLRRDYYHNSMAAKAAWNLAYKFVTSLSDQNAMVLSRGNDKPVQGIVGEDVLVLANLHPSQADAVMKSKAVVTEMGGALAHLAIITRESGIPMVLVPNARKLYPAGTKLLVDPVGQVIDLTSEPFK